MTAYNDHVRQTAPPCAYKVDGSPVTDADLLAHQIIATRLGLLTPSIPVISEEDVESHRLRATQSTYWLIDPLDGTKEFLAGTGEFTINIALIEHGATVAGVVVAPAMGLTYWGGRGMGAWCDSGDGPTQLAVAPPDAHTPLRVIVSRSHLDEQTRLFLSTLPEHTLAQAGSSLKLCCVADGSAHLYPRFAPTCEWDVAAAQAVLEGAGGHVVCLDGTPLRYGKASLVNPPFIATSGKAPASLTLTGMKP